MTVARFQLRFWPCHNPLGLELAPRRNNPELRRHDGIVQDNLLASYAHLRAVGGVAWTDRFLARVRALS